MNTIRAIEQQQIREGIPEFRVGDTVEVSYKVVEGTRERVQLFKGIVISRHGAGARENFAVRKMSFGVGVERKFPVHSPKIMGLKVERRGDVSRAKLYFLRDRIGKKATVRELRP